MILDENFGASLHDGSRGRLSTFSLDATLLNSDSSFFDDEISEWSSDDEDDDDDEWEEQGEDLLGLSFVEDETQQNKQKSN